MNTYLSLLMLSVLVLGLVSCGESRQVNPGAKTAWIDCNAADLERFVPAQEKVGTTGTTGTAFIERYCLGYCLGDGSAVYVWHKAPDAIGEHEFCHLVDVFHGDWIAARASLGAGVPAYVDDFCVALSHAPRWAGYQWSVLQDRHPHECVILHPELVALVKRQRGEH